ncbi:MAG TPA: L-threonylcarbamoyladenylate synthase [bacterium]|nr:L-threonylcarbamoyladenylate synthase [bacterium]
MIRTADSATLAEAVAILRQGGLVAMPTETVYGLAADAFNAAACARIFEVKARPTFDPLIVHLASAGWLDRVADVDGLGARVDLVERLVARFWPGPLTLVLPKAAAIPGIVTSGLDSVAVRVPAHPVALELLRALDRPLAAPSANRFGELSPTKPQHVLLGLGAAVPLILDGGPCSVGVESTIVDLSGPEPRLLRPGGLPREVIEEVLGFSLPSGPAVLERPLAPGQLASHYAPGTPLRLLAKAAAVDSGAEGVGLLSFTGAPGHHHYGAVEVLSPDGSLAEAAARLFDCLHRLDGRRLERIDAEPVPAQGLGLAIMDRLQKASAKGLE